MNKSIYFLLTSIYLFIAPTPGMAQSFDSVMRSSGRIYVVIAVLLVILIGIFMYMFRVERKLKKLEREDKR